MKKNLGQRILSELTSHLRSKLVMLVLAGLCWLLVRSSQEVEVEFDLPLFVDLSQLPGQVLVNKPPEQVHVRLRGRGSELLSFALFKEGVYHLHPDVGSGTYAVSAKHLDLEGAENLSVQSIFPAVLQLKIDELATRRLPVRFRGEVESADGYKLTSGPRIEPTSVVVMGPRSVVDTLVHINTDWTELLNRKRDLDVELKLRRPWPTVDLAGNSASLRARIEKIVERRFHSLPVQLIGGGDTLQIEPDYLALTVIGGEQELSALSADSLRAWIDVADLPPGRRASPCRILVPDGYQWKDPSPSIFRLLRPLMVYDSLFADSLRLDSLAAEGVWRLFP